MREVNADKLYDVLMLIARQTHGGKLHYKINEACPTRPAEQASGSWDDLPGTTGHTSPAEQEPQTTIAEALAPAGEHYREPADHVAGVGDIPEEVWAAAQEAWVSPIHHDSTLGDTITAAVLADRRLSQLGFDAAFVRPDTPPDIDASVYEAAARVAWERLRAAGITVTPKTSLVDLQAITAAIRTERNLAAERAGGVVVNMDELRLVLGGVYNGVLLDLLRSKGVTVTEGGK